MGVNRRDPKMVERLIPALLAAHPGFTPNYSAMAVYFGHGASYDSIESRFRPYRQTAAEMRAETPHGATVTPSRRLGDPPSTPRITNGRISKAGSSSRKTSTVRSADPETPTNKCKDKDIMRKTIVLDDDDDDAFDNSPRNANVTLKREGVVAPVNLGSFQVKDENHNARNGQAYAFAQDENVRWRQNNFDANWLGVTTNIDSIGHGFVFQNSLNEFDDTA
ncbi:hypothetical protein VTO42DRAFT_3293 [Malbranchea cinnamomea]